MKRTYITPAMAVSQLASTAILAGSPDISVDVSQETETMDVKGSNFFDDEDDI